VCRVPLPVQKSLSGAARWAGGSAPAAGIAQRTRPLPSLSRTLRTRSLRTRTRRTLHTRKLKMAVRIRTAMSRWRGAPSRHQAGVGVRAERGESVRSGPGARATRQNGARRGACAVHVPSLARIRRNGAE
jgi:hypothetical protein